MTGQSGQTVYRTAPSYRLDLIIFDYSDPRSIRLDQESPEAVDYFRETFINVRQDLLRFTPDRLEEIALNLLGRTSDPLTSLDDLVDGIAGALRLPDIPVEALSFQDLYDRHSDELPTVAPCDRFGCYLPRNYKTPFEFRSKLHTPMLLDFLLWIEASLEIRIDCAEIRSTFSKESPRGRIAGQCTDIEKGGKKWSTSLVEARIEPTESSDAGLYLNLFICGSEDLPVYVTYEQGVLGQGRTGYRDASVDASVRPGFLTRWIDECHCRIPGETGFSSLSGIDTRAWRFKPINRVVVIDQKQAGAPLSVGFANVPGEFALPIDEGGYFSSSGEIVQDVDSTKDWFERLAGLPDRPRWLAIYREGLSDEHQFNPDRIAAALGEFCQLIVVPNHDSLLISLARQLRDPSLVPKPGSLMMLPPNVAINTDPLCQVRESTFSIDFGDISGKDRTKELISELASRMLRQFNEKWFCPRIAGLREQHLKAIESRKEDGWINLGREDAVSADRRTIEHLQLELDRLQASQSEPSGSVRARRFVPFGVYLSAVALENCIALIGRRKISEDLLRQSLERILQGKRAECSVSGNTIWQEWHASLRPAQDDGRIYGYRHDRFLVVADVCLKEDYKRCIERLPK